MPPNGCYLRPDGQCNDECASFDCCTVFVPKHPVINPRIDTSIYEEEKFDYNSMIDDAVQTMNTIKVYEEMDEFTDLL